MRDTRGFSDMQEQTQIGQIVSQLINALRSHLAELGIAAAHGHEGLHSKAEYIYDMFTERTPVSNARRRWSGHVGR